MHAEPSPTAAAGFPSALCAAVWRHCHPGGPPLHGLRSVHVPLPHTPGKLMQRWPLEHGWPVAAPPLRLLPFTCAARTLRSRCVHAALTLLSPTCLDHRSCAARACGTTTSGAPWCWWPSCWPSSSSRTSWRPSTSSEPPLRSCLIYIGRAAAAAHSASVPATASPWLSSVQNPPPRLLLSWPLYSR